MSQTDNATKNLQLVITASLYHSVKLPDKDRHQYCPKHTEHKESWCPYQRAIAIGKTTQFETSYIIWTSSSSSSLLLLWTLEHKNESGQDVRNSQYKYLQRVETVAQSAALQFHCGMTNWHQVMRDVHSCRCFDRERKCKDEHQEC